VEFERLKELVVGYFSELPEREKKLLIFGVPLLFLLIYVFAVLLPIESRTRDYEKRRELLLKKAEKLEPKVRELYCLKKRLEPLEEKLRRGANLDVPSFLETVGRMVGLKLEKVQFQPGETFGNYERDRVFVKFSQQELNRVTRFIERLERSSYYFKSDGISISDFDGDGLVSGRLSLLFFRRVK